MKKILSLVLLLFSFIIVGCEKAPSYVEFLVNNIVMEYDSTYEVKYNVVGEVSNISFDVEDEEIVTFENDILTAHNSGETTLTCNYNGNESVSISVKVLEEVKEENKEGILDVGDPSVNEQNFNLLKNDLADFSKVLNDTNYLSLLMNVKVNDQNSSQSIRAINDPIYLEIGANNQMTVIAQEGNKVFQYSFISYNYFDREYIGTVSDYDDSNENNGTSDSEAIIETTFDKEKCNVEYSDDTYTIKCYYKDAINEESKEMLEELFKSSGLSVSSLYDTIVTFKYVFYEEKMYMSCSLTYKYNYQKFDISISYDIDCAEFTPIDFMDGNYLFTNPDNFEEVYKTHDFNDTITLDRYEKSYLKIEVDKGMLVINSEDISAELYDINGNLVSNSMNGVNNGSYMIFDSFIPVEEKGTYYLIVKNRISTYNQFKLEFHQYETLYNSEGIDLSMINSHSGEIEGKYDFEKFIYNNTSKSNYSLRVENNGLEMMYVFQDEGVRSLEYVTPIEAENVKYLTLKPGKNELYICHDFYSNGQVEAYEYNANFKILNFELDGEVFEEDIPEEFTLPEFEDYFFYTKLEKGSYSIVEKNGYSLSHSVDVYDKHGAKLEDANVVPYGGYLDELATHFVISEDDYYFVGVHSHISRDITLSFSKYNYQTTIDKKNPKSLDVSGVSSNIGVLEGNHDFEYYTLENNTNDIKIYKITNDLEKSITLIYKECEDAHLMDEVLESDDVLFFASYPNEVVDFVVCQDYTSSDETSLEYSFKVEEMENNNVTDLDDPNMPLITNEFSEDYYMRGYGLPVAYLKLELEEDGFVSFEVDDFEFGIQRQHYIYVMDETGKKYNNVPLKAGTYYVILQTNDYAFDYFRIRYDFYSVAEQNINVTLQDLSETNESGIYNEKVVTEQVVNYHFTLTEKSTVYYNSSDVVIYKESGKKAVLVPTSYWYGGESYVDLEAGNYYFNCPKEYGHNGGLKTKIRIGLKSIDRDAPQDFSNMVELTTGKFKTLNKDYYDDNEYLKVNIQEAKKYKFYFTEGTRVYLYDENKEYIDFISNSGSSLDLETGVYYVVVEYTDYSVNNVSIKVE